MNSLEELVEVEGMGLVPEWALDELVELGPDESASGHEKLVRAEFSEVGGGSTAWLNLVAGLDSAEQECTPDSDSYWEWAWNTYRLAQGELSENDQRLSMAYDLEGLSTCSWCQTRDTDESLVQVRRVNAEEGYEIHLGCLAEKLREEL